MAKAKLRTPARVSSTSALGLEPQPLTPRTSPVPWWIAFSFLTVLAILLTWLPISRINAHYVINYNEGWNVWAQQTAATGGRIYGQPPLHEYWNYPPLSFHIIGWVGRLTHDYNLAGRWITLLSFFASVARLTGSRRSAAFSALLAVIFIGALKSERIAINDPHQLGMAFIAFGFYAYVRAPDSPLWLRISAAAFVLGLFTKHSLLAFPLAVAIHLALTSPKRVIPWIAAGAATAAILLVLTFALDGPHLLEHLAFPRVYSYAFFLSNTVWFLLIFQTAIIISLAWCFRARLHSIEGTLVWSFAAGTALGFWFSAGAGSDLNHLFDSLAAMAMIGGVALPYAVSASERVRHSNALLAVLLTLPFTLGVLTMLAPRIQEDLETSRSSPRLQQEFAAGIEFLKAHPGPALCEQTLMCIESGKGFEYDPYQMDQLMKTGKVSESGILALLDGRHFSAIQLLADGSHPMAPVERPGFSQAFMTHLLNGYKPAMQTSTYMILVPK
jgi:hypothetical protein